MLRRLAPLLVLAGVSFLVGLVVGGRHEPAERKLASQFVAAWERGDYAAMHAMLTPQTQDGNSVTEFANAYRDAAATATTTKLAAGRASDPRDGTVTVPIAVQTRIFGAIHQPLTLPIGKDADGDPAIAWDPGLVFPGLKPGEKLTRRTAPPHARDDPHPRRQGDRTRRRTGSSDLDPAASEIAGTVGPAPPERAQELEERGVPAGAPVGLTGLEREFDAELTGTPGGELLRRRRGCSRAGRRSAARACARRSTRTCSARPSRRWPAATAGSPPCGRAPARCSGSRASRSRPRSRPAPSFKIITLSSALAAKAVKENDDLPGADARRRSRA